MIETGRKLLILTGIVVSGCATTEPLATFYTLDPGGVAHSGAKQSAARSVRVYVNRVILPAYLNRTNLASFRNNQVEYSSSAFWAIPLDQAIAQAVARNLSALGVSAIGFQPMASPLPHSYEISIRVTRCEGYDTGDVVLSGVWELRPAGDGSIIASNSFAIHRSGWQPGHYPSLASLLADEVRELSKQIASRIADSR
jgi:uncharacterized lipoprotein YmbA